MTPPQQDAGKRHRKSYYDTDWRGWWQETVAMLTVEQIDAVWELFDRLRLVEVVELPLDRDG